MSTPQGQRPPEAPPLTLPMQPKPSLIVIHLPDGRTPTHTVISRHWRDGSCVGKRLCPPGMCGVTRAGMCTVVVPGVLCEESARFHKIT